MWRWLLILVLIAIAVAPYAMLRPVLAETTADVTIQAQGANTTTPTVITLGSNVTLCTAATLNGNITDDQGGVDRRGFVWDTVSRAAPSNITAPADSAYSDSWAENGAFGNGTFSHGVTGLSASTTYYVRAAARAGGLWGYGNETTFTTSPCVDCDPPGNLTATLSGSNVTLTWSLGSNSTWTYIRVQAGGLCPANYTDGSFVYSGNGTTTSYIILDSDFSVLCFRAWSGCGNSTISTLYAEASIDGGDLLIYIALFLLAIGLSVIAFYRPRNLPWTVGAATMWVGLFAYWVLEPPTAIEQGSPAHVIITVAFIGLVVGVMLEGLRRRTMVQEKWDDNFVVEREQTRWPWEKEGPPEKKLTRREQTSERAEAHKEKMGRAVRNRRGRRR